MCQACFFTCAKDAAPGSVVTKLGFAGFYAHWDVHTDLGDFATGSDWATLPQALRNAVEGQSQVTVPGNDGPRQETLYTVGRSCTDKPWMLITTDTKTRVVTNVDLFLDSATFCGGRPAPPPSPSPPAPSCPSYYVVDSRGSGEPQAKPRPPGGAFIGVFQQLVAPKKVKVLENGYPARGGFRLLAGAKLSVPAAYHDSVRGGVQWLSDELPLLTRTCRQAKIVLLGYSQGAQVTGDVVQRNGPFDNLIAVVLFGDPYFNSRDARVDSGDFRVGTKGGLGSRPKFAGHLFVRSYCHGNDPVCQNTANPAAWFTWHNNYDKLGQPASAAREVARLR
jgi:hypothetical protein